MVTNLLNFSSSQQAFEVPRNGGDAGLYAGYPAPVGDDPGDAYRVPDFCDFLREDLSLLYDYLPIGYMTLDEEGRITSINNTAANMLGQSKQSLRLTELSSYIYKRDQKHFRKNGYGFFDLIRSGHVDLRMETRDKLVWARFSLLGNGRERSHNRHIHLAIEDITGQKRTEQELGWQLKVTAEIEVISRVLSRPEPDIGRIRHLVLTAAVNLTQSSHGFIAGILPGLQRPLEMSFEQVFPNRCAMENRTMTITMDDDGRYSGLLGQSLKTLKPFFTNPPHEHHPTNRLPQGHVPIDNFLSVPVVIDHMPTGMIVIANSRNPYSQHDVQVVTRLAKLYTIALLLDRAGQKNAQLEIDLYRARQHESVLEYT